MQQLRPAATAVIPVSGPGRGTGSADVGFGVAGGIAHGPVAFYANGAYNFIGKGKRPGPDLDLADRLDYGGGLAVGPRSIFQGIVEMAGETFVNKPAGFPRQDPSLDLSLGFKLGGSRAGGMSFGAAYTRNLAMKNKRASDGGPTRPHGFIAQLSFTSYPKPPEPLATAAPPTVNHPPSCTLTVSPKEVYPAFSSKPHKSTATVQTSDPDGDHVDIAWSASSGAVSGSGASVEWTPMDREFYPGESGRRGEDRGGGSRRMRIQPIWRSQIGWIAMPRGVREGAKSTWVGETVKPAPGGQTSGERVRTAESR